MDARIQVGADGIVKKLRGTGLPFAFIYQESDAISSVGFSRDFPDLNWGTDALDTHGFSHSGVIETIEIPSGVPLIYIMEPGLYSVWSMARFQSAPSTASLEVSTDDLNNNGVEFDLPFTGQDPIQSEPVSVPGGQGNRVYSEGMFMVNSVYPFDLDYGNLRFEVRTTAGVSATLERFMAICVQESSFPIFNPNTEQIHFSVQAPGDKFGVHPPS